MYMGFDFALGSCFVFCFNLLSDDGGVSRLIESAVKDFILIPNCNQTVVLTTQDELVFITGTTVCCRDTQLGKASKSTDWTDVHYLEDSRYLVCFGAFKKRVGVAMRLLELESKKTAVVYENLREMNTELHHFRSRGPYLIAVYKVRCVQVLHVDRSNNSLTEVAFLQAMMQEDTVHSSVWAKDCLYLSYRFNLYVLDFSG